LTQRTGMILASFGLHGSIRRNLLASEECGRQSLGAAARQSELMEPTISWPDSIRSASAAP